jgi:hypothetical protein
MIARQNIFIFFFCAPSLSLAQPATLEPLIEWSKSRPNWSKDATEYAYLGTRCGALYSPIGSVFFEYAKNTKEKETGEDLRNRGRQLSLFGFQMASDQGWSTENIMERYRAITEIYFKTISSNRVVHNNMFHGFIKDDFQFCVDFEKAVRAAANAIR